MRPGSTGLFYCGRVVGVDALPGSDGQCGKFTGPACASCMRNRVNSVPINTEYCVMKAGRDGTLYCGRFLGKTAIPGSDGRCGPTNGPQCQSCKDSQARYPQAGPPRPGAR